MLVTSMPLSSCLWPPEIRSRPSGMKACPEQNSIVSTGISMALVGGPLAGSQSRGIPITVPPGSNLPHASSLPLGRRCMCSGTMSQFTSGPHLPVVASAGSGERLTGAEVTLLVPAVNSSVCAPVPLMPRSPNFATPEASVVAVVVPSSVPPPEATLAVTSTPAAGCPPASVHLHHRLDDGIEHLAGERRRRAGCW